MSAVGKFLKIQNAFCIWTPFTIFFSKYWDQLPSEITKIRVNCV